MTQSTRGVLTAVAALAAIGLAFRATAAEVRGSQGQGGKPGVFRSETIEVNGIERAYRLVAPESLDARKPMPLVFAFHGLGDSKDFLAFYSKLDDLAKREGFLLVYPNGRLRSWPLVLDWARNDLALFDALYAHVTARYNVDLNRVYLTGMSNGAYFSHLLASQRAEKIAAVAAHSGGLGLLNDDSLAGKRKYAVMVIHGDDDWIVPVDEGRKTRDFYRRLGYEVEYVEVPDLNHVWAHKAEINHRIWKFFVDHPLR